MSPRTGPVHVNIPRDILANDCDFEDFQKPENYRSNSLPASSSDDLEKVNELIVIARKPVIIIGGGIKNSEGHVEVLSLAEKLNIPIIISPGHGDTISFSHLLNAGQMGPRGNIVASRLAKEADVILALGTRFGFNSTFYSYDNININASIIQVKLESTSIGRYCPISIGIWADVRQVARQLLDIINNFKNKEEVNKWIKEFQFQRKEFL